MDMKRYNHYANKDARSYLCWRRLGLCAFL